MKVDLAGFDNEYKEIGEILTAAVDRVLRKGVFILGEELSAFEREFAHYLGVRNAVGMGSGSDALYLALKALGIGKGDEVITPSHTFVSTADAIVRNGATPVFVDIEEDTYCIDPARIEERITERTKAILPVHLYGHPVDMDAILSLAEKHGLNVVEDACQAHGAEYRGRKVGSLGDAGCFSFYPTKNLGAYGDGGMVVTHREDVAEVVRMLRNYGRREKDLSELRGINSRLDELQAAALRIKLAHLDEWNERRRSAAAIYGELLSDTGLILPREAGYARHVYHLYVVRSERRGELREKLERDGVATGIHYPIPVHLQPTYRGMRPGDGLEVTEKVCGEILSLPMHALIKEEEVERVASSIKKILH